MSVPGRKGAATGCGQGWTEGAGCRAGGSLSPLQWSFLMLSGPVTSFQSRASLTEQAEKGGEAKQLSHQLASPMLPWIAGFVLLLSGCSNKSYKH